MMKLIKKPMLASKSIGNALPCSGSSNIFLKIFEGNLKSTFGKSFSLEGASFR